MRPDHYGGLSRRQRLGRVAPALAGQRAGEERRRQAEVLEQRGQRRVVLAREQVRRGEQRGLPPVEGRRREGPRRHGRLARADVALDEPEHRHRAGEVVPDLVDRRRLVAGQRRGLTELPGERGLERGPDPAVGRGVDRDGQRLRPPARTPPSDHPQLQREQLVEREAPQRGVAGLERGRVVGVLERLADRRHVLRDPDRVRQVLRVVMAGTVERDAHRRPQAVGRQAAGQPVDGDDAADVEEVRGVGRLELGTLEHQVAVAVLDLARDQELVARADAAFDVAAPEPGGDGEAGAVREPGRRDLHAPPPRLLDRDVDDANLRRGHRTVIEVAGVGERPQLAQVVVPTGQVEQEVADRVDSHAPGDAAQARDLLDARHPDRGGQQLGECRRARCDGLRLERPTAACGRRATSLHLAHRRAPPLPLTRPRRGTGSAAGRRGSPRRRPPGSSRAPCARGSPPRRGWPSRRSRSSAGRTPARAGRGPS